MDVGCEDSKHADEPVKIVELEKMRHEDETGRRKLRELGQPSPSRNP